jgi:hypothetical protein
MRKFGEVRQAEAFCRSGTSEMRRAQLKKVGSVQNREMFGLTTASKCDQHALPGQSDNQMAVRLRSYASRPSAADFKFRL